MSGESLSLDKHTFILITWNATLLLEIFNGLLFLSKFVTTISIVVLDREDCDIRLSSQRLFDFVLVF